MLIIGCFLIAIGMCIPLCAQTMVLKGTLEQTPELIRFVIVCGLGSIIAGFSLVLLSKSDDDYDYSFSKSSSNNCSPEFDTDFKRKWREKYGHKYIGRSL